MSVICAGRHSCNIECETDQRQKVDSEAQGFLRLRLLHFARVKRRKTGKDFSEIVFQCKRALVSSRISRYRQDLWPQKATIFVVCYHFDEVSFKGKCVYITYLKYSPLCIISSNSEIYERYQSLGLIGSCRARRRRR